MVYKCRVTQVQTAVAYVLSIVMFILQILVPAKVYAHPDGMAFPIIGPVNYSDTFYASRSSGVHHAIDIFAPKHASIVAVQGGTVTYVGYPQPSWGWEVEITDDDGFTYLYIHMNNDNPGTDDGGGGAMHAYAPDIKEGNRVARGQLIGYVGDSGNAENTPPHLHFEIIKPGYGGSYPPPLEGFVNPFVYLNAAQRLGGPLPYPPLPGETLPYGNFHAGVSLSKGSLSGGQAQDLIVGAGSNGGPHVKIYDSNLNFTGNEFMAYSPSFMGGIDVAAGDVDGDGKDEIITGAGTGGGPHVRVINPENKTVKLEFFAYSPSFMGGVKISSGDVDGDGKDEIITGAGPGGGPHVRVFDEGGQIKNQFFAYNGNFYGGIRISSGDAVSVNPNSEIVTMPWSNGGSHMRVFTAMGAVLDQRFMLELWWEGRYDVAVSEGEVFYGTGHTRRSSIRRYAD